MHPCSISSRAARIVAVASLAVFVLMALCSEAMAKPPQPNEVVAKPFGKIADLDPVGPFAALTGHATALEGGAFGPNGQLYFTDTTAPPGAPKVMSVNLKSHKVTPIYSDAKGAFTSIQFSPIDHLAYLTDIAGGAVDRMKPDGSGFETVFSGPIDKQKMAPDDLAFDRSGNMYVSDMVGTPWAADGRIVRIPAKGGHPQVLLDDLASPNGISFTPDYSGLWISEFTAGREDHLTLSEDGTSVLAAGVGMMGNPGPGGFDSNAIDSAGNVYQCVYGAGRVLVWSPTGKLLRTIVIPQNLPKPQLLISNLVIKPGTRHGYLIVGGSNGGYLYQFKALAPGGSQSNGGGAS
jgi:lactonase